MTEHDDDPRLVALRAEFAREEEQLTAGFYDARPYLRTVPVDEWTDDELDAHAERVGDFYDRRKRHRRPTRPAVGKGSPSRAVEPPAALGTRRAVRGDRHRRARRGLLRRTERSPHLFPELYDAEDYERDVRELRRLGVPD